MKILCWLGMHRFKEMMIGEKSTRECKCGYKERYLGGLIHRWEKM